MFLTSILGIFKNKYVLIGIVLISLMGYHYYEINKLENKIEILDFNLLKTTQNYNICLDTNKVNTDTIESLKLDIDNSVKEKEIVVNSYIEEIHELKNTIESLSHKVDFGKTKIQRIETCSVKIKTKDNINVKDKEYSIFSNFSSIGN